MALNRNRLRRIVHSVLLALPLLAAGCAALSKDECTKGDWFTVGYNDAWAGEPPSHLGENMKACAEYGVTINYPVYGQGYRQGLAKFCTPSNGFSEARAGKAYYGQCPADSAQAFMAARSLGDELYTVENAVGDLNWRIGHAQNKIDDKDTSDGKRRELRGEIREMQYELRQQEANAQALRDEAFSRGYR